MTAFDFSPSITWAFVFPHPDDEIAVAAAMKRLVAAKASVHAIWLHATPRRKAESQAVAGEIGLDPASMRFLDFADGEMDRSIHLLKRSIVDEFERIRPDRVVAPAFEQGHLDHDAAHVAVRSAFLDPILEYPCYWPYTPRVVEMNRFADPSSEEILNLEREEQDWKRSLARRYPSQRIWTNLVAFECVRLLRGEVDRLYETERLRLAENRDFRSPSVPERYRARVLASSQWARWLHSLDACER